MKRFRVCATETITAWVTVYANDIPEAEELVSTLLDNNYLTDIEEDGIVKILDIDDYVDNTEEIE